MLTVFVILCKKVVENIGVFILSLFQSFDGAVVMVCILTFSFVENIIYLPKLPTKIGSMR